MFSKEPLSHFRVYRKSATSAQTDGPLYTVRSQMVDRKRSSTSSNNPSDLF